MHYFVSKYFAVQDLHKTKNCKAYNVLYLLKYLLTVPYLLKSNTTIWNEHI